LKCQKGVGGEKNPGKKTEQQWVLFCRETEVKPRSRRTLGKRSSLVSGPGMLYKGAVLLALQMLKKNVSLRKGGLG